MTLGSRGCRSLSQVTDRIRQLPGVAQVRVDGRGDHLEIRFEGQSRYLLRAVHAALRSLPVEPVDA